MLPETRDVRPVRQPATAGMRKAGMRRYAQGRYAQGRYAQGRDAQGRYGERACRWPCWRGGWRSPAAVVMAAARAREEVGRAPGDTQQHAWRVTRGNADADAVMDRSA